MIETIQKDGKDVFRYSWQPTLEDGTPIGGLQVVEADKRDDIPDKIRDSYVHLYRNNRDLKRQVELSSTKAPDGAEVAAPAIKLQPRALTAEERIRIAREINDPEKVDGVADLILEAKLGGKPGAVAQKVDANADNAEAIRASQEAAMWRDSHPEFHASQKNVLDIANWIQSRGLKFTYANFDKAYEALAPALETVLPSAPETPAKPPETQTPSRIAGADESGAQPQPKVPTTVSRRQASGAGTVKSDGLTIEQIQRMPTAEYRKRLQDPKFAAEVNALFSPKAR